MRIKSSGMVVISLSRADKSASVFRDSADWRAAIKPAPIPGLTVCNAAIRYEMNRSGSLSPASSDNHPTSLLHLAIHSLIKVVLPKPAEAEMSANLQFFTNPSFSQSISLGRETIPDLSGGMYSFVANSGMDITLVYSKGQAWWIGPYCQVLI